MAGPTRSSSGWDSQNFSTVGGYDSAGTAGFIPSL
jgi:hypothetical protein